MKIITLISSGKREKMYKPHEVAEILGYHPRTIRRLIKPTKSGKNIVPPRITAVDSNPGGKQPVWWISETEINRLKKTMMGMHFDLRAEQKKIKALSSKAAVKALNKK